METLVAIAIFAISSGILYQTFVTSMILTAKNTALNTGNTSLQRSYYRLLSSLESAASLVDCANYNASTQTFTPVATGTWGNSVRFMRQIPVSYYVLPVDGSGYTVTNPPPPTRSVSLPSTQTRIVLSYNSALYSQPTIPASARLYPAFPSLFATVSGGKSPGSQKPGLSIASAETSVPGQVTITLANALGSQTLLDCNRAYLLVESAFAVTQSPVDGHKELLYFEDTNITGAPLVICNALDGGNQTQANDPTIPHGGTAGTFCMAGTMDAVQTLLPIRSRDSINVVSRRGGSAARNNTWLNINTKFHQREDL